MDEQRKALSGVWEENKAEILLAVQICLSVLFLAVVFVNGSGRYRILFSVSLFTVLGMNVLLTVMRRLRKRRAALEEKIENLEFMERMEQARRLSEQKLEEESARLRTALSEELLETRRSMEDFRKGEDGEASAERLSRSLEQKEYRWGFCANILVQVILLEKQEICAARKIRFEAETDVPARIGVEDYDLCSVFANLLDNAIEACGTLPEEKRRIHVKAAVNGDYLYVQVENSTAPEHASRPAREGHGLGTRIVAEIAERYDGEFTAKQNGEEYVADVVLRVRKK